MHIDPQSRELLHGDDESNSKQQAQSNVAAILSLSPELSQSIEILDADVLGV